MEPADKNKTGVLAEALQEGSGTSESTADSKPSSPSLLRFAFDYKKSHWVLIPAILILIVGLFTVGVGTKQILDARTNTPYWDEWDEIHFIAAAPQHNPPISWIWAQHNEHRIVFYRLLLLADIHFFHGQRQVFFWSMLLVQYGFLGILVWLVRQGGVRGPSAIAIIGLAAFCLFCPSQWENFGWAFQISFLLPGFFFGLALASLLAYATRQASRRGAFAYVAIAIVAAWGATYSIANGAVVWPLLLIVIPLLGLPRHVWLVSAVAAIAAIALYLYHYSTPGYHSSPAESLRHPVALFEYVAKYLGVALPPWTRFRDPVALFSGALGLLLALTIVWIGIVRQKPKPITVVLMGIMLFSLATAFITAMGRIGFGTDQAFQSRYQTYNLLFWFALISLCLLFLTERLPSLQRAIFVVIPMVMIAAMTLLFPLCLRASRLITARTEAAAVALMVRVPDTKTLALLNPDPLVSWEDGEYFRNYGLSIFSGSQARQLDRQLVSGYEVQDSGHCAGEVNFIEKVPDAELLDSHLPGARLTGSAIELPSRQPVRELVIASQGKIIGLAVGGLQGQTHGDKRFLMKKRFDEWSGLVPVQPNMTSLEIYAVDNHRPEQLCSIGTIQIEKR